MTSTGSPPAVAPAANPLRRAQVTIGVVLVLSTAAAWTLLAGRPPAVGHAGAMAPTMGMAAPLFLGLWLVMVVAMMFPSAAPMILMFARVAANRRSNGRPLAPTSLFVGGYVLVWSAVGVAAFALAVGAEQLARRFDVVADHAGTVGALLVVVAGLYQFSSLKDRCMTECRSPLAFLGRHWREGALGAVGMGVRHGLICVGCCWALMAVMFPLGMMNIAALGVVTGAVYAEKMLAGGKVAQIVVGVGLLAFGLAALADPGLLPGGAGHVGGAAALTSDAVTNSGR